MEGEGARGRIGKGRQWERIGHARTALTIDVLAVQPWGAAKVGPRHTTEEDKQR
jgi:hypothetical protein